MGIVKQSTWSLKGAFKWLIFASVSVLFVVASQVVRGKKYFPIAWNNSHNTDVPEMLDGYRRSDRVASSPDTFAGLPKGLQDFFKDNEQRLRLISNRCRNHTIFKKLPLNVIHQDKLNLIYCYVPKVACTNWKRLLLVLNGTIDAAAAKTVNPHQGIYPKYFPSVGSADKLSSIYLNYTKFMFTREPLARLLSAYRAKFGNSSTNKDFHSVYGRNIIKKYRHKPDRESLKTGENVTFPEFCLWVMDNAENSYFNEHWKQIHKLCSPCTAKYDYIGKYENFTRDANAILRAIFPKRNVTFPPRSENNDNPASNTFTLMVSYYRQLPPGTIRKLWQIYSEDYHMFDYPYPKDLENEAAMLYSKDKKAI